MNVPAVPGQVVPAAGWRVSTWVAVTLTSLGIMSQFYVELKDWGTGVVVRIWNDTVAWAMTYGIDFGTDFGREAATEYINGLIDNMKDSVGSFANMPGEAAAALKKAQYWEAGISVALGLASEWWVERFRKKGDFSWTRALVYISAMYGGSVAARNAYLTHKAVSVFSDFDGSSLVDWEAIRAQLHGMVSSVFGESTETPSS